MSLAPRFLGLDCFQLEIIGMLKRHFGVANFAPQQWLLSCSLMNGISALIKEISQNSVVLSST